MASGVDLEEVLDQNIRYKDDKKQDYRMASHTQTGGVNEGEYRGIRGMCLSDNTGYVVVADTVNDRLQVIDPEDLAVVRSIAVERPFDVCYMDGYIFATQLQRHRMMVYNDADGYYDRTIEPNDPSKLMHPAGIASCRKNGVLYVCDSGNRCVRVFQPDGTLVSTFGHQAFSRCPPWYISTSEDKIYISDSKKALHVFNLDGEELNSISPGSSQDESVAKIVKSGSPPEHLRASGLATDSKNNLVVCDPAGRLIVLADDGSVITAIGVPGEGQGQLCCPQGVAVTKDCDIVVGDDGNNRIVKFEVPWI